MILPLHDKAPPAMMKIKVFEAPRKHDRQAEKIPPALPRPPFRMVISAPSNSGKSNLIKNILYNKDWGYIKYFKEFYIWCGSLDDCAEYRRLGQKARIAKRMKVIQEYDDDAVRDLYNDLEADPDGPPPSLFIFDDQVFNNISKRQTMNTIDRIFMSGRHANISIIITTQQYRKLNVSTRSINLTHLVVFSSNRRDMETIADEHGGLLDDAQALQLVQQMTAKRFAFMVIDYTEPPARRFKNMHFEPIEIEVDG